MCFYFLYFLLTVLSYFVISSYLIYVPLIIIIFSLRLSVHNFDLSLLCLFFFFLCVWVCSESVTCLFWDFFGIFIVGF